MPTPPIRSPLPPIDPSRFRPPILRGAGLDTATHAAAAKLADRHRPPVRPRWTIRHRCLMAVAIAVAGVAVLVAILLIVDPTWALAKSGHGKSEKHDLSSLNTVIGNLRWWAMGLLAGLATLFLTIGGMRYLVAGGDPGEIEKSKIALKGAAIGYALAVLAPLLLTVVKHVVHY